MDVPSTKKVPSPQHTLVAVPVQRATWVPVQDMDREQSAQSDAAVIPAAEVYLPAAQRLQAVSEPLVE